MDENKCVLILLSERSQSEKAKYYNCAKGKTMEIVKSSWVPGVRMEFLGH